MSQKLDSSSNQFLTTLILSMDGIWLTPEHSEQIKKTIYGFFIIKMLINGLVHNSILDTFYLQCFSTPDPCWCFHWIKYLWLRAIIGQLHFLLFLRISIFLLDHYFQS